LRYQTIYATREGSVAAPTAGLHFTDVVFKNLKKKGITIEDVILHVGAGTFKPVSSNNIRSHRMHAEQMVITEKTIRSILENMGKPVIAVGTTTVRTIESLYWFGVKQHVNKEFCDTIDIGQWDPYQPEYNIGLPVRQSLEIILGQMRSKNLEAISGQTQLMIVPGYTFRIPDVLITNFHLPRSTLLLLVSAFTGQEWKKAYEYALSRGFRFLSFGDACLFYTAGKQVCKKQTDK
jgi:S-adenosylmethionine:tRNA ribosyltransferase-isomerase